ncbi:MAG: response regulator [Nitrospirae bacterium]|nr:response regulator [Nitrospirota bacterium]
MKPFTILIVEDSPIQMEMLRRTLVSEGFDVLRAINGKEGLSETLKSLPDIIISDISMPEMDGYHMCYEIKHSETIKNIPVILFTQFSDPEDIIKGLVSGADNFVVKPYSNTHLLGIVRKLLAERSIKSSVDPNSGIAVTIEGKNYSIHSDRRQILNLLLSTYESAVKRNSDLTTAHLELKAFNETLEKKVVERTNELMTSELRYKALLESASDGILIADIETGLIRYGNQVICAMLGYTSEELLTMYIDQLHKKEDVQYSLSNYYAQVLGQKTAAHNIPCIRKDGKIIYADFNSTRTTIDDKVCTLSFVRDVTDRVDTEKRLSKLHIEIKSAQKDLSDFSYVMSHDLKTPLRAIVTLADWIETDYFEKTEEGKEKLAMLVGRVRRIHDLIEGILKYSSVGQKREEKTPVDINQLISEVITIINPTGAVKITVAENMPTVVCEKSRIEEVFLSLLSNAVKYNDKPIPLINITYEDDGFFWKFGVRDNGKGIEEKYFKKIFQIFQTLKNKDELESIGVGLSLAQKIIELHGGRIWVESTINVGTTVYFTLTKEA